MRAGERVGDVGDYFADFCAKVGEVMRKTYEILLFVGGDCAISGGLSVAWWWSVAVFDAFSVCRR